MPTRRNPRTPGRLQLMLYGRPGSGKTWLGASAAADDRTSPALHLDIGGNTTSLATAPDLPDVLELSGLDDLDAVYQWLRKGMPAASPLVQNFGLRTDYKTIILDGITEIQRLSLAAAGGLDLGSLKFRGAADRGMYNNSLAHITSVAQAFLMTLNKQHVIVTALEDTRQEGEDVRYLPHLAGKAAMAVTGYALNLGRVVAAGQALPDVKQLAQAQGVKWQEVVNIVYFRPRGNFDAKDQHGFGVTAMIDPNISKFLDLWERRIERVKEQYDE